MRRKATDTTRGANSKELAFCGWVKEQCCIICGDYPVIVDHFYGSAFKHHKQLIGPWALIPLCEICDSYHTHGSERRFMNKFCSAARLILDTIDSSSFEPPPLVREAIEDLMITEVRIYEDN